MASVKPQVIRVQYYEDGKADDLVTVGLAEAVQVERYCRAQGIADAETSAEASLYAIWSAARRLGLTALDFDGWMVQVSDIEAVEQGESQAPLA